MNDVNIPSTNVNRVRVHNIVNVLINRMVTDVFAVGEEKHHRSRWTKNVLSLLLRALEESGWTGRDCSEDIDECETMKPCKAARNCINQPGSYKCECLENFVGQNCEMVGREETLSPLSYASSRECSEGESSEKALEIIKGSLLE